MFELFVHAAKIIEAGTQETKKRKNVSCVYQILFATDCQPLKIFVLAFFVKNGLIKLS
jgi:hypothetical protein